MRQAEPAVDDKPDRNVGDGEALAHHVGPALGQMLIEQPHHVDEFLLPLLDIPGVIIRRFLQLPSQKRAAKRVRDVIGDPVHPLFDGLPALGILWIEIGRTMLGREISDDGVGFTHCSIADDHHGHLSGRVQPEKLRRVGAHEAAPEIFARVGNADLVAYPQHFAHVERVGAPQDPQRRRRFCLRLPGAGQKIRHGRAPLADQRD